MNRLTKVAIKSRNEAAITGARTGCVSILGSSMGCAAMRSQRASAANAAAAVMPSASVAGESQPLLPPSVRHKVSDANPANDSAAPRISNRRTPRARCSLSSASASAIVNSVSGTRARNMARHPNSSTSTPPPSVATIIPSVAMPAIIPSALPRCSDGNMAVTSAGADAIISPLPTDCSKRSPRTAISVGAMPISNTASAYADKPMM